MGGMTWIFCLTALACTASSKESVPTGFVMLHQPTKDEVSNQTTASPANFESDAPSTTLVKEFQKEFKDPLPNRKTTEPVSAGANASTDVTQMETLGTKQNSKNNSYSTNAEYHTSKETTNPQTSTVTLSTNTEQNMLTETTTDQKISTAKTEHNNMLTETTTDQKSTTGLSQNTGQRKSKLYQIHFSFGVEDGKLKIEINNITKNNRSMTALNFPDRKFNTSLTKDKSDKNHDSKRRIVKKRISPNSLQIKICMGRLSKTNYCNSIGKCEKYANWLGEIIGTMNSTEALNLYIQMDSMIWQELVNKNNNCENLNYKRAFVEIIFKKTKKGRKIKSEKDVNIFYVDTMKGLTRRVDVFQNLCLPADQCLKLWFPKEDQSVPLYNIQISRNPPEYYVHKKKDELFVKKISCVLPDWMSVFILFILIIILYVILWFKCPCVRNEIATSQ